MKYQPYQDISDVIGVVYESYNRVKPVLKKDYDRNIRHPEWTRRVLDAFGAPDRQMYNVAVTGSKGKGSHSILLAGILQKLGYKVGLFTGPHLVNFMERFRVNGQVMSEQRFADYVKAVAGQVAKFDIPNDQYIGPVGFMAVVAALWFRDEATDVNIFECGRGALHDDVNQIVHQGALLSPVFLEHPHELGPTLKDVVVEKLGVITPETRWICSGKQNPTVCEQLCQCAETQGVVLRILGRDFDWAHIGEDAGRRQLELRPHKWSLWLRDGAAFLFDNAATAYDAALQVHSELGRGPRFSSRPSPSVDVSDIRLPGRLHVVCEHPLSVVDGTIHAESARYIVEWAKTQIQRGRVACFGAIVGLPHDKDVSGVLECLAETAEWVVVTQAKNPYLHFDDEVARVAGSLFRVVRRAKYIDDAMVIVHDDLMRHENTGILMMGTQSFVGDVLRYHQVDADSIWTN